jgi:hypothetical protein
MHLVLTDRVQAGPRRLEPQRCYPRPVENGAFEITGNSAGQPVGDGVNEKTEWQFDLSNNADVRDFRLDPEAYLDVAEVELCLTPGRVDVRNDTVQIKGLAPMPVRDAEVSAHGPTIWDPPGTVAADVRVDLLNYYEKAEILGALLQHEFRLPMVYAEDSIIHRAFILLEQWDRMYLAELSGRGYQRDPIDWRAQATVVVQDTRGNLVPGARIEAAWPADIAPPVSGITDERGACVLTTWDMSPKVEQVTFTVLEVSHDDYLYDPAANPDQRSDPETSIIIRRPASAAP